MRYGARSRDFDVQALFVALDERRRREGLSWAGAAADMWRLSAELNERRQDHPISPSTLTGMAPRGDTTCQHALVMLRWLGRAPEEFIATPHSDTVGVALPVADSGHRLRWDLVALHGALNEMRGERGATWQQAAQRLRCTPSQLTGLPRAKYATGMRLAMRICQGLGRPSTDFICVAEW
ncbi:MAG: helix-turn-helix transcriptional regulator [Streptosporangiaceae bacterium]